MEVMHPQCASLDLRQLGQSRRLSAACMASRSDTRIRTFRTTTRELGALAD